MTKTLKTCYRSKLVDGKKCYKGLVKVIANKEFHYFVNCEILRLTKADAIIDAETLAKELAA